MKIADKFNNFLTNIGTDFANKIPDSSKTFDSYLTKVITKMESRSLSMKDVFLSLKINKSPGDHEVSFNIIKNLLVSFWNR